jgi:Flp pilus assembly protein TadD
MGNRDRGLANLGTVEHYRGRAEAAGRAFEAALAIDSTDHRVWGNLGAAYRRQSAPDEAVRAVYRRADQLAQRSLAVNPHQPDALIARAEYLHQLDRSHEARALITQALEDASGQVHVLFAAGHLYELMGERARASRLIASALERGYPRWVIERDPELAGLREDPTYDPLSPPRTLQPEPIEVPS